MNRAIRGGQDIDEFEAKKKALEVDSALVGAANQ